MLLPSIISLLVVPLLASPLLPEGAEVDHHDEDVDSRLLTSGTAGDYTLVSIPWTKNTALSFNDTTASTLSTLGNAALLVGGLYLLSGFQGSALSDPFGISRRFGQPALPGPPPQRVQPQRIQHKAGQQAKVKVSKRKTNKQKKLK